MEALRAHGISQHHRRSFGPIKELLLNCPTQPCNQAPEAGAGQTITADDKPHSTATPCLETPSKKPKAKAKADSTTKRKARAPTVAEDDVEQPVKKVAKSVQKPAAAGAQKISASAPRKRV